MKETGLSKTTVYALCDNSEQIPNGIALNKICDCYKVQPCELLEWSED
ncbi:helix-turn-helix transcriptional regulator (plasmid) [Nostoc sp. CALU 1950]|nr:helix-turn-helix transcriptional regulator [Nostoc sp. NMS2]